MIEALVVLAVGGMALAIIFSIGTKAGDTGFRLGRRAMAAADSDIAISDLRAILRSFVLRPPGTAIADLDTPFSGEAMGLSGDVVMERSTLCGPQGWAGRVSLAIETRGSARALTCTAGSKKVDLVVLPRGDPSFAYSPDGRTWGPAYSNDPSLFDSPNDVRFLRLFVRFADADQIDVVETSTSGRFEFWIRNIGQL